MESPELTLSLSIGRKITDGNFGSYDAFACLSGITKNTTAEEMDELLSKQGALALPKLKADLKRQFEERMSGDKI